MKTTPRPVNPFPKEITDEASGLIFTDERWKAWDWCRLEMDKYYQKALQDPIDLLGIAEGELVEILEGLRDDPRKALIAVRKAKEQIDKVVNEDA